MNTYIDSKIITLNSQDGIYNNNNTYKSNIDFNFNGLIKQEDNIQLLEISLVNAQIPVSWYIINYTNNNFIFKLGNNTIQTVVIPVGNYNATTLINTLKNLINDSNFSITISKITGKITFSYNLIFYIYANGNNLINTIIGFDEYTYMSTLNNNIWSITPPFLLNILGYKRLEIYSNNLQINNFSSKNNGMTNILGIIPIDQPPYGLISYHNYNNTKHIITNNTIDSINIQIKAEDDNYINFNNIDWTIQLKLDITRINKININNLDLNILNSNSQNDIKKDENIIKNDFDLLTYK